MNNPITNSWVDNGSDKELLSDFTSKRPIPEVVSRNTVYELGLKIKRPIIRAFFYMIYLTGARVSEGLMIEKRDIQIETLNGESIITVRMKTLKKKRGTKFRMIPIWISKENNPAEYDMWQSIRPYVRRTSDGRIFTIGGDIQRVRRRVGYYFGKDIEITTGAVYKMKFIEDYTFKLYPHYLRHCRLSHMSQIYGFDEIRLMRYAGWSTTRPASIYVHYNWIELAKWMVKS